MKRSLLLQGSEMWQGEEIEFAVPVAFKHSLPEVVKNFPLLKDGWEFLQNGSRCYLDAGSIPGQRDLLEVSTPECRNAYELACYDRAAEILASNAFKKAGIPCYKIGTTKNILGYDTRGLHESYNTNIDWHEIIDFLAIREILFGSGGYVENNFVISPRAPFICEIYAENALKKPMVLNNGRDYGGKRLQLACSDENRLSITVFLRNSITSLVIEAIEENKLETKVIENPLLAIKYLTYERSNWKVRTKHGEKDAIKFIEDSYLEPLKDLSLGKREKEAVKLSLELCENLKNRDYEKAARKCEWALKNFLFEENIEELFEFEEGIKDRNKKDAINNQYCAITDELFEEIESMFAVKPIEEEDIKSALYEPPANSRGILRKRIAEIAKERIEKMGWDFIIIDGRYKHIPLKDYTDAEAFILTDH